MLAMQDKNNPTIKEAVCDHLFNLYLWAIIFFHANSFYCHWGKCNAQLGPRTSSQRVYYYG